MNVIYLDFRRICRLCLKETETCPFREVRINVGTDVDIGIVDILEIYLKLKISQDDSKPQNICETCIRQLFQCYGFFKMCSQSDSTLNEALKYANGEHNVEDKDEELEYNNIQSEIDDNMIDELDVKCFDVAKNSPMQFENETQFDIGNMSELKVDIDELNDCDEEIIVYFEGDQIKQEYTDCLLSEPNIHHEEQTLSCMDQKLSQNDLNELPSLPKFTCYMCTDTYRQLNDVICHFKEMHKDSEKCILCNVDFPGEYTLDDIIDHMNTHAIEKPSQFYEEKEVDYSENENLDNQEQNDSQTKQTKKHQCFKCGMMFGYVQNFRRHLRVHHGHRLLCHICKKVFTTKINLDMHIQTIHNGVRSARSQKAMMHVKNYMRIKRGLGKKEINEQEGRVEDMSCKYCQLAFKTVLGRKIHEAKHLVKTEFLCRQCDKAFPTNEERNEHIDSVHVKFRCQQCGKGFATDSNFRLHVDTHNNSELFRCTICNLQLKSQTNLKSHVLIHTGEKPFECGQCGKTFRQPSHLRYHQYQHSGKKPFECQYCDKTFGTRGYLETHTRIHTGERPFFCEICGKSSHDKVALRRHLKTHKNELLKAIPNNLMNEDDFL